MFNFHLSYRYLSWHRPSTPPSPLPDGVVRHHVNTPSGQIELLQARLKTDGPSSTPGVTSSSSSQPVFFVHGGMGSAWVWLEYMTYLSARGVPCYAVSMRGHGESWHPSYLRMVWLTTKRDLADDVLAGLRYAQALEGEKEVVLVGHSSGGGISQFILSEKEVRVKGLVLMGAVPGFGSLGIYINWWKLDPLFTIRMWFHLGHPNSPLSHPTLTRRVFFHGSVSDRYMEEFQRHINAYECFWWPLSMMRPFVDFRRVLAQIDDDGSSGSKSHVMVLRGQEDRLMTRPVMERLTDTLREARGLLVQGKKIDDADEDVARVSALPGEGGMDNEGGGVRLCVVPGAGHHMQNDIGWEIGAQKLLEFTQQL